MLIHRPRMTIPSQRVAVIGAGISGVVAAAHLRNEGIDVTVYERSREPGGIWLYDERKPLEPSYRPTPISKIASTYESGNVEGDESLIHAPPGPCYVGLKNNVSTPLLETTLNPFPENTPDFVTHNVLKEYIQDTAIKSGVHAITKYSTEVVAVEKRGEKWEVETSTLKVDAAGILSRTRASTKFDSVIVASGHYHAPKIPSTAGLSDWKRRWPDRVQHSKGYRTPENAQGKTFLLIGGSVSSTDIARELGPFAKKIYQSHRHGIFDLSAGLLPENGQRVDEVVSYDDPKSPSHSRLGPGDPIPATVTLKSGHKLCDIDQVILATGYHLVLPFLSHLQSDDTPAEKAGEDLLVTDGNQFHNLHKDIFYINDPSLVFVGVPFFTATFSLFEFQAMVIAKVLSGQARLPSTEEMRSEYVERVNVKGYGKPFHSLREKEVEYVDELLSWINADLENAGKGKLKGHTKRWHEAKAEQIERMKALFAAPSIDKPLEVVCP